MGLKKVSSPQQAKQGLMCFMGSITGENKLYDSLVTWIEHHRKDIKQWKYILAQFENNQLQQLLTIVVDTVVNVVLPTVHCIIGEDLCE